MNLEERASAVVKVFGIIDKGTATDSKQKEKMLELSYLIVRDFIQDERLREMEEKHREENAKLFRSAVALQNGTSAELNIESADKVIAVHEPEVPAPEVEEKPAKVVKSKKAKPEAAPEAVTEAADEEAPF